MRFFLRVDGVLVRINDTRLYLQVREGLAGWTRRVDVYVGLLWDCASSAFCGSLDCIVLQWYPHTQEVSGFCASWLMSSRKILQQWNVAQG